jgi:hypothetical protein
VGIASEGANPTRRTVGPSASLDAALCYLIGMGSPTSTGDLVAADPPLLEAGARATYVSHRRAGEWFFGAPGFLARTDHATRVPLERLLDADPSLREVCDLAPGWHAFRNTPADPWWSSEIPAGDTFFLAYETRPTELLPDRDGIGGAFASCWLVSPRLEDAVQKARAHLEESGWAIVDVIREQAIAEGEVPVESRPFHRQAQVDGEVYVIHAFPPEAPDA